MKSVRIFSNTHRQSDKEAAGLLKRETRFFGVLTRIALRLFQRSKKLSVTGVFDLATSRTLDCGNRRDISFDKSLINRDLKMGMTGEDVRELQKFLNLNSFTVSRSGLGSKGNETDYFGASTRLALTRWQIANNIKPANGYLGPASRALITR